MRYGGISFPSGSSVEPGITPTRRISHLLIFGLFFSVTIVNGILYEESQTLSNTFDRATRSPQVGSFTSAQSDGCSGNDFQTACQVGLFTCYSGQISAGDAWYKFNVYSSQTIKVHLCSSSGSDF